ncbi:MAG: hypothetical protein OXT70_15440 [Chloroflexota bacterium]|nr:hypothetical protein [Chloroflexota bacterium]
MSPLSDRHHEVPRWLLEHFTAGHRGRLWVGFKKDRRVQLISTRNAFVRRGANSRVDYVPQSDGSTTRVKSDAAEMILAEFDRSASVAARELIEIARRWRETGPIPAQLPPRLIAICKRLLLVQARRTREAQDRIGIGNHDPLLIADLLYARADELRVTLPCREELIADEAILRVFDDIAQNNRATFAGGQHPLDLHQDVRLLAQRGLRIAVLAPSIGDFVIGSHGITTGRTINGWDSWLPLAPDVAISHSDSPGDVRIALAPPRFLEWHNRTALRSSERVGGSCARTIRELLATAGD